MANIKVTDLQPAEFSELCDEDISKISGGLWLHLAVGLALFLMC